jgi:hypothetical protein
LFSFPPWPVGCPWFGAGDGGSPFGCRLWKTAIEGVSIGLTAMFH